MVRDSGFARRARPGMTITIRASATGRSGGNGAAAPAPAMEWYPIGRVLLWTTGFAALTTMAALFTLGSDAATISGALRRGLLRIVGARSASPATGDTDQIIDAL